MSCELRQGVIDQRGQDGARQVRCGAFFTGMCLQGGGRPESHHSRFFTLVSMFVCAPVGYGVWAYCMLRCTVAMEKTRSTVWSEAQQLADNDDACIYTCIPGWVQYTYSWMQGQKSVGPSSLPFPFSRDKSPSFSRPPFKTCAAVNHCMQAGKLR